MSHLPMPQLLKKLPLQPDESVVSLVQRHCEANYVDRMLDMLRLIARVAGEPVEDVRDIAHSRTALTAVERLTGQAAGALNDCFLAPVQGTHVRARHHVWELGLRRTETQAVCLTCLRETGYARRSWEFTQAPVCLVHGVALFERCPSCTKPLRHRRTRLLACESCGRALGKSLGGPTEEQAGRWVPQAALEVAHLVQRPVMLAMGDPDYTAPIDPQELSGLLRLCLPVGAGRDPMSGLSTGLESLPVAERIDALDRLGAALLDRRIDSARLRAVVESRWLWARHVPAASRLHLLRNAALAVELAPDVTRLLCHGSDVRRDVPAAVQFAKPLESLGLYLEDAKLDLDYGAAPEIPRMGDGPIVALHPGSGSPKKNWSFEAWARVLATLHREGRVARFLITSGEVEGEVIGAFLTQLGDAGVPHDHLAGRPLAELAAVYRRIDGFLGHDSGLSHLAASAGAKGLLLFGPTEPGIWAPVSSQVRVIRSPDGSLGGLDEGVVLEEARKLFTAS